MITLLQTQPMFTDADRLLFSIVWGILSIISANILIYVWKQEEKEEGGYGLSLLSYAGAIFFGTLVAPVITGLALLGWLGTITPNDARKWISKTYNNAKEATIGHWRDLFGEPKGRKLIAKQAPPGGGGPIVSTGGNNQIYVHSNPPSIHTQMSGPFINDLMNVQTYKTASLQSGTFSAPPPPGPHPNHVNAAGIVSKVARKINSSGPNAMTRLSNGSIVAPNYVPKAKKAAPKM